MEPGGYDALAEHPSDDYDVSDQIDYESVCPYSSPTRGWTLAIAAQ